jgi:hypothetical protein
MLQEGNEPTDSMEGSGPPAEGESSNRTFLIAAGILAALVFIIIVCMAIYGLVWLPRQQEARAATDMAVGTVNAEMFAAMTSTAEAAQWTPTVLASPTLEMTYTPSPTPVVAMPTATATPDVLPLTATMAALRTQVAIAQLTPTGTLAMPRSGIADEIGLPGLIIGAITLVAVILLARRLRAAPAK